MEKNETVCTRSPSVLCVCLEETKQITNIGYLDRVRLQSFKIEALLFLGIYFLNIL